MVDAPLYALAVSFPDETGARDLMHKLDAAQREHQVEIEDSVVLNRDVARELNIAEIGEQNVGRGALIGAVAGAVVGMIAGPVGWATLGGAAVGGLTSKLRDSGFPDKSLRDFGDKIGPGSSGLLAIVRSEWLNQAQSMFQQANSEFIVQPLSLEMAQRIEQEVSMLHKPSESKQARDQILEAIRDAAVRQIVMQKHIRSDSIEATSVAKVPRIRYHTSLDERPYAGQLPAVIPPVLR